MPTERLAFDGRSGGPVTACLDLPDGPHLATALFAHCFACGPDQTAPHRIAGRLAAMGIAVLRVDFTGLDQALGDPEATGYAANIEDLRRAAAALDARGMAPSLLIGHSLAGAAMIALAPELPSAKAVVSLGAPFDLAQGCTGIEGLESADDGGAVSIRLQGGRFRLAPDLLAAIAPARLSAQLSHLHRALLVMHAPRDKIVSIDNAAQIFTQARHPKSFITLDTADHLISTPEDAEYAADVIAAWAGRYIELRPPAPPPGAPEGVTRVSEADPEGFLNDVNAGPFHHSLADEPKAYGGTNRGMSPYQFLTAGLGACTSMTLRMYARRKKWPLEHIQVEVSHDRVHAQDCTHCTEADKIEVFTRRLVLHGPLDDAQRARLLEIADRCPVHRTLSQGARIDTVLEEGAETAPATETPRI
ncbi:OsmC family protein [Thioclava sp. BHET1]|nr:OsmC family protein [Thioclava sp. BHET1]